MVGEEARLQGLSEEVETACVHNSFKNVGCEGETGSESGREKPKVKPRLHTALPTPTEVPLF